MSAVTKRARCPWCKRPGVALRVTGKLWRHMRYTRDFSGEMPPVCAGSNRVPKSFYDKPGAPATDAPPTPVRKTP